MYYPYLRCKQFELQVLRENTELILKSNILPILEPVKEKTDKLNKTLQALAEKSISTILILNPKVGEFYSKKKRDQETFGYVLEQVQKSLYNYSECIFGFILTSQTDLHILESLLLTHKNRQFAIIHNEAFKNPTSILNLEVKHSNITYHIFIDQGSPYENSFQNSLIKRVTIKDAFKRRANSDYPEREFFSDLHLTYKDSNMHGFGDFMIVGDHYSDLGGAAKALAIHMTNINPKNNLMYVSHFISDTNNTRENLANKFYEALSKLVKVEHDANFFKGKAYNEFIKLYKEQHYPGLGMIKKISMHHHLELMSALS